jgi:hypothetical protein
MEAGLDRLAGQPDKQDLTALGIFIYKKLSCVYMDPQAGWL